MGSVNYYQASQFYTEQKDFELALEYAQKSLAVYLENFDGKADAIQSSDMQYFNIENIYYKASQFYADQENFELSIEYAQKSLETHQKYFPNDNSNILQSHYFYIQDIYFGASTFYAKQKNFERALQYAQKSLAIYQEHFPDDTKNLLKNHHLNIQKIYELQKDSNS